MSTENMPRAEHPRPQFMRENWINLNGEWEFEIDNGENGMDLHFEKKHLSEKIVVPFCPESKLSDIGNTDFMNCVWYRRDITVPKEWTGKNVILHFGAVDYHAYVYVNGTLAGEHKGGYTSFSFDITSLLTDKENCISVCAIDRIRTHKQPSGKQSVKFDSHGCLYTRTTGIWQTVWLEAVDKAYIKRAQFYPNLAECSVRIDPEVSLCAKGLTLRAEASFEGATMGAAEIVLDGFAPSLTLSLNELHLWELGCGRLYDLTLTLLNDGIEVDRVTSYFGMRSVDLTDRAFRLNGKTVFGRWVLDQGFYPDGIYTAPTDEDLKNDILYSMQLGFNGARLHEKVFEERFLYWADKLGYMVWGEHANWGFDFLSMNDLNCFLPEWTESVRRDFNHPAIIGWCPFNETWNIDSTYPQTQEGINTVYHVTKALDSTRPVIDTSGNYHSGATDIFDVHDYEQDPAVFKENYAHADEGIVNDQIARSATKHMQTYRGEPLFISEYGGIGWVVNRKEDNSWGYGNMPKTEEEFIARYKGLTEALLKNKNVLGFCYTQLYDVEQEVNGLMTYDRKFKFDPEIFKKINEQKAAIEE